MPLGSSWLERVVDVLATLRSGRAQVCFWEDDGVQFNDPDYEGGANEVSLRQARDNYREIGVSAVEVPGACSPAAFRRAALGSGDIPELTVIVGRCGVWREQETRVGGG